MNTNARIKLLIKHLIGLGIASNQKGIGFILGYKTESAFSQVVNGKVPMPDDFIERLSSLDSNINRDWVRTGNGEMIVRHYNIDETQTQYVNEKMALYKEKIEFYKEKIGMLNEKIEKLEDENNELKKNQQPTVHK